MCNLGDRIRSNVFWIALLIPVLFVVAFGLLEYNNYINYVDSESPYDVRTTAELVGASVSIFLTYGLVILYRQQAKTQSSQESLMKNEHKPKVELVNMGLSENSGSGLILKLSNSGKGTATNLVARMDIVVDSNIDVELKPQKESLTREIGQYSDTDSANLGYIIHSSGQYLSPEEGEVDFQYSDRINARESNGGSKTIDGTSFSLLHYYYARVNNDDLDLSMPGPESRELVNQNIDFDRFRIKYTIFYEDIDNKEYQREVLDYIVPILHGEDKQTWFEVGMPYNRFIQLQQQEVFQRVDYDPLESQVMYHFDVDQADEVLPSVNLN